MDKKMNANKEKLTTFLQGNSDDNICQELDDTAWSDLNLFELFVKRYDKTKKNHPKILKLFISDQSNQVKKIKFLVSNKLYNEAVELFPTIQDENTKTECMNFFIKQPKHFKELYKEFQKQTPAKDILIKFLVEQLMSQPEKKRLDYLKKRDHLFRVPDCCIAVLETNNSNLVDGYFQLLAMEYLKHPDENLIPTGKEYQGKLSEECYKLTRPKILDFLREKELIIDPVTHKHILNLIGKDECNEKVKELLKQHGILNSLGLNPEEKTIEKHILDKLIKEFTPNSELEQAYKLKKQHQDRLRYSGAIKLFLDFTNEKNAHKKLELLIKSKDAYLKTAKKKNLENYDSNKYFLADDDFTNKLRKSISNFALLESYYYLKHTTPRDVDSIGAIKELIRKFTQEEINKLARTLLNKIIRSENNSPAVADVGIKLLHKDHKGDFPDIYNAVETLALAECENIGRKIVNCLHSDDQKSLNGYKEQLKALSGKTNLEIDQAIEKLHEENSNTEPEESIFISSFLSSAFDHKEELIRDIKSRNISNRLDPKALSRTFDERSPQMIAVLKSKNIGKALFKLNQKPFSYWPETLMYDFNGDIQSFNNEMASIVVIFGGKPDRMLKKLKNVIKSKHLQSLLDQAIINGNTYIDQERIKHAIRTTYEIELEYGDITEDQLSQDYTDMSLFGTHYPYQQIVKMIKSRYIDRSVKEALQYAHLVAIKLQEINSSNLKTTEKQILLSTLISIRKTIHKLSFADEKIEELTQAKASLQSISGAFENFDEQIQSIENDIVDQLSDIESIRKEILSEINSAKINFDEQFRDINLPKFTHVIKSAINNQDIVIDLVKNLLVIITIALVSSIILTNLSWVFAVATIFFTCVLVIDSFNKIRNAASTDELKEKLKEDPSRCFSQSKDSNAKFLIEQAQNIIKKSNSDERSLADQYRLHLIYDELGISNYQSFIDNLDSPKFKQKDDFNASLTHEFLFKNFNLNCDSLADIAEKIKTRQAIYQQLKLYARIQCESVDNDFLIHAKRNGAFLNQNEAKVLIQAINNPEKDQDLLKARFTNLDEIFKPSNFPASSKEITSASRQKKQQPSQQLKRPPHKQKKRPPLKPEKRQAIKQLVKKKPNNQKEPIQWYKLFSRRQTRIPLIQRDPNTIYTCSFRNLGNTCWINAMLSVIVNSDLVDNILTSGKDPANMSHDEYTLYRELIDVINSTRTRSQHSAINTGLLFKIFNTLYVKKDPNWDTSGGSEPSCFLQEIDERLGSDFVEIRQEALTCSLFFHEGNIVHNRSDYQSKELTIEPYDSNQKTLTLGQCLSHQCRNTKTDGAHANTVKDQNGNDINYDYTQTVLASKPDTLVVNLTHIQTNRENKPIDHREISFLVKDGENYSKVFYRIKSETVHVNENHWLAKNYEYNTDGTRYCHTHNDSSYTKNDFTEAIDSRFNIAILEKVGNETPLTKEEFLVELNTMTNTNKTPEGKRPQGGLLGWFS